MMARRLRCPSCKTTVTVEPGAKPVCPTCGFGREDAPTGSAPSAQEAGRQAQPGPAAQATPQQLATQTEHVPTPPPPAAPSATPAAPPTSVPAAAPPPPPAAPAPEPPRPRRPEEVQATGRLTFGSPHVPDATLYDDEEVLVDLETKTRDVGLWHTVLGHKERVVVTSRRVFGFTRTRNEALLRTLEIERVSAVESGGVFHMGVWASGALLMLLGLLIAFVPLTLSLYLGLFSIVGFTVSLALALVVAAAGVLTILRATPHGVSVHAGPTSVELPLHPSRGEEAKRLVDSIQRAIRARGPR